MRKLLQKMPQEMIVLIMPQVYQHFLSLSKNKNAVCVMKCVLKCLHEQSEKSKEINQYLKKFLDTLTLNTQQLINDEYGNYLIQEAFDLVGCQRLGGISEFIVNFFVDSACSKFANNVVLNCVKKHWKKQIDIFQTLKQNLDNKKIVCMYHNK